MASTVLSFVGRVASGSGWTNAELAELYRVEHALVQARITLETERGVTDEGDPWFVFCRENGDVVVHVTRIGGYYHLYSPALPQPLVGTSFSALTKSFVSGVRSPVQADASISIHPAALLSVLIAAIIYSIDFHAGSAKAAEVLVSHEKILQHPTHVLTGHKSLSELPTKDTIFHTLVTSIKAILDPGTESGSQHFSFISVVELAAAVAGMVGLSSLIDIALYAKSEFLTATLADDHNCLVASCQNDFVAPAQPNDKAGLQTDNIASDTSVITLSGLENSQSDGEAKYNLPLAVQRTDTVSINVAAPNGASVATNADSNSVSALNHLVATDGAQRDGATVVTVSDGSFVVTENRVELAPSSQSSNATGVTADNATGSQDIVLPVDSSNAVNVMLTQSDGSIDLSASAPIDKITLVGDGTIQISGVTAGDNPQIVVAAGFTQAVSLSFAATTPAFISIQLNGSDNLSLAYLSSSTAHMQLTLDSEGSVANVVTIADQAVGTSKLDIKLIGVQDLTLNESGATFNNTSLDTTGLSGSLTVGLDLNNVFQSIDLSQVNAANFIVGDSGNIALLHAASGSHIQLSSDLNIVDLTVAGATIAAPGSLAVDLDSGVAAAITVNLLDVFYTSTVALNSSGAGPGGSNMVETLTDSSLSTLTITGDSALTVTSINGLSAGDGQNVTIDAHTLTASLNLDVSNIADTAALGRLITLIGGSGVNILTNDTASESTTFVAGAGNNVINIGGGAIKDSVVDLKSTDTVNIGAGTHSDIVFNELAAGADQATIDAQGNLIAAAQQASNLAASNAAQQAVLFSYQGNLYVFVDAAGNHTFDSSHDAIVKLVGVAATANLTGVFHSA